MRLNCPASGSFSGWVSGRQPLKSPATETWLPGLASTSKQTRRLPAVGDLDGLLVLRLFNFLQRLQGHCAFLTSETIGYCAKDLNL